jgi:hydrogenase maturation protein HypF
MTRLRLTVHGTVQGVGFRPFVHAEATRRGLTGHVRNSRGRVEIEVQGPANAVDAFVSGLRSGPPPIHVRALEALSLEERSEAGFRILESTADATVEPSLPADLGLCAECAREIRDPTDRRYRYPFTTCARCGPRYAIVHELPYDRGRTSMRTFALCDACSAEYGDPTDRRYHAETIACPRCGPRLSLVDPSGSHVAEGDEALAGAADLVCEGRILALKGLGGFQLLCVASNDEAVTELRRRKRREEKPFAMMFPNLDALERVAAPSEQERALLTSAESPIVLVRRRPAGLSTADRVTRGNSRVGAMLPYTPLHALLLDAVGEAVVCTSGNVSSEPMCVEDVEALTRLRTIADYFLVHDRTIVRPVDDSVARVGPSGPELLRRARGYAPRPVAEISDLRSILALGAHQKSVVALAHRGRVVMSQHIGDLGVRGSDALLGRTVDDLLSFYAATPEIIACDLHPDYASTRLAERLAERLGAQLVRVQHHAAHVASVAAEHGLDGPLLGFAWDGAGLGADGTIWGGEALVLDGRRTCRVAHLASFPLPGGDRAAREPRRSAAGLLWQMAREDFERRAGAWFSPEELGVLDAALARGVNAPHCSSVGRWFDAVAALLGLRAHCSYEGQAAMELEFLAETVASDGTSYPLPLTGIEPYVADARALLRALLDDVDAGVARARIARRFHDTLALHAVAVARKTGLSTIALSGGCFQNAVLARRLRAELEALGFAVHSGQAVPCNDGGIALGQIALSSALTSDAVSRLA